MPTYKVTALNGQKESIGHGKIEIINLDDLVVIRATNKLLTDNQRRILDKLSELRVPDKRYLLLPKECEVCKLEEIKGGET